LVRKTGREGRKERCDRKWKWIAGREEEKEIYEKRFPFNSCIYGGCGMKLYVSR
jgi:hypothetical protein